MNSHSDALPIRSLSSRTRAAAAATTPFLGKRPAAETFADAISASSTHTAPPRVRFGSFLRPRRGLEGALILLALIPTLLLLYALRQDVLHSRLALDTSAAGSLRNRAVRIAVLTRADGAFAHTLGPPPAVTQEAQDAFQQMRDIHERLRETYPAEMREFEPAWNAFASEWIQTGSVRWETAERLRLAAGDVVDRLQWDLAGEHARERAFLYFGAAATLLSLLTSLALFRHLRRTEDRLHTERRFTDAVLETVGALVLVLDRGGRIVRFNRACETLTGYTSEEALAETRPFWEWLLPAEEISGVRATFSRLHAGDFPLRYENEWLTRDGSRRRIAWSNTLLTDLDAGACGKADEGEAGPGYIVATGMDVTLQRAFETDLREANVRLQEQALTDSLTGLANRRAFDDRLEAEWERAVRYGLPLSLLLIDVDQFKAFNDAHGHPAGDDALRAVARILAESARGSDLVARNGGEEFAVLLPHADRADALAIAERMRRSIAGADWPLRAVSVSVGVATRGVGVPDLAALVANADVALYAAKAERDCVRHARDMRLTGGE